MALRNKKNELAAEKRLFERKRKRAKRRESRKLDYRSSDYAGSTQSSRCDTPVSGIVSPPSHTSSFVSPLSPSPGPCYSACPSQIHAQTLLSPVHRPSLSPTYSRSSTPNPCRSHSPFAQGYSSYICAVETSLFSAV